MGVALGSAGCLSLLLRDTYTDEAPGWTERCAELVTLWFNGGFDAQGACYEGVLYSGYGLSNAILFADALRRAGGRDLFANPHLRQVPHFLAQSLLPGEKVYDARNDSVYQGLGDPALLRLAIAYGDGLAKWLWEQTGTGVNPFRIVWANDLAPQPPEAAGEALAAHFEGRGLAVFRTGWDSSDVMFSVEAGPYQKVTHNQADKGHFTLYGLGERWAIDSGYVNNRRPGGRDQTVAHNCVLIDGEGQALSGAGAGTSGAVLAFEVGRTHDYALVDATEAYNRNSHDQPGAVVDHALRHAVFVRPSAGASAYVVLFDDIRKDNQEHDYTWMLHTDDRTRVRFDADGATFRHRRGASGGAFLETPADADGKGACEWRFEVAQAGEYAVWAEVRAGGPAVPKSDSFVVRMDGGKAVAWHMPGSREWVWGRVAHGVAPAEPISFPLTPGEHILRFETREPGAQVDRLFITPEAELKPPFLEVTEGAGMRLEAEQGVATEPMRVVREEARPEPRLRLWLTAAAPVGFDLDQYESHPRLKATARAVAPEFAVVLAPLPDGSLTPSVVFERREDAVRVTVRWPGRVDTITWPRDGARRPGVTIEPSP